MEQNLIMNLIPFNFSFEKIPIYYSDSEETPNIISKKLLGLSESNDLPESNERVYWDLKEFTNSQKLEIKKNDQEKFRAISNIVKKTLQEYFLEQQLIVDKNFTSDIIVLEKTDNYTQDGLIKYKQFIVRIIRPKQQYACFNGNSWFLSISYGGKKEITKKPLKLYTDDHNIIKKVLVGNKVKFLNNLTVKEKQSDNTKVIVSNKLRKRKNWPRNFYKTPNKYSYFYNEISNFYEKYLKGQDITIIEDKKVSIFSSGFQKIIDTQIIKTKTDSNLLTFGENQTHFSPYYGIKEYGPLQSIEQGNYKFFFIFHKEDRDIANKLYTYFTKGTQGFPGLFRFANLNVEIDKQKTIEFTKEENLIQEIKEQLESLTFDLNIKYLGIYISRIKKDDIDPEKEKVYYKLKQMLLEKNITSQVIYRDNINNPDFRYFLPNIGVAILAKLGGIPWRLSRPIENDLVIGVGAFRPRNQNQNTYIGTTMTFKNDGSFVAFDSSKANSVQDIANFLRNIILDISKKQDINKFNRIIIHYYKMMSKKESKIIENTLEQLNLKIPYIVLHITESGNYIPFDTAYNGKMPVSGTCIIIKNKWLYLLCNNERYSNTTGARIKDYPFPIQIKVSKASQQQLSITDIKSLIDQVYQFSRMYWRSVKQKEKPVTILYSEQIAKMSSGFDIGKLPSSPMAKKTVWFL